VGSGECYWRLWRDRTESNMKSLEQQPDYATLTLITSVRFARLEEPRLWAISRTGPEHRCGSGGAGQSCR